MYTVEEGKKKWKELGEPYGKIPKGTTILVDGKRETFLGFVGCPSLESMTIRDRNYKGCGCPWERPGKGIELPDQFYTSLEYNLDLYSNEKIDMPSYMKEIHKRIRESEEKFRKLDLEMEERSLEAEREMRVMMLESRNPYRRAEEPIQNTPINEDTMARMNVIDKFIDRYGVKISFWFLFIILFGLYIAALSSTYN